MRQFYLTFQKGYAVRSELSLTHYRLLMRIENENARAFYENECVKSNWSTNQKKCDFLLFLEYTNITKQHYLVIRMRGAIMNAKSVTCSFSMDREIYNAYKSVVVANGENVKGNMVRYMQSVIQFGTPNADTIQAIEEVQQLKKDPNKKVYSSFSEILEELDDE